VSAVQLRAKLEAAIEAAILALDMLDGDSDDEPWLGSICGRSPIELVNGRMAACVRLTDALDQTRWAAGALDDREWQCEDEGADDHTAA
jgi:hypothetical protein